MRGVEELLATVVRVVPLPVLVILLAIALWFGLPGYTYSVKSRQIRERVRRRVRATPEDSQRWFDEALTKAGEDPNLVLLAGREAHKRLQVDLYKAALQRLKDLGAATQIKTLEAEAAPPNRLADRAPSAIAVLITGLLDEGLIQVARGRLDEALEAHPTDTELLALRARIDTPTEHPAAPPEASPGSGTQPLAFDVHIDDPGT